MNLFNKSAEHRLEIRAYRKAEDDGKKRRRKGSSSNPGKLCPITQRAEGSGGVGILAPASAETANGGIWHNQPPQDALHKAETLAPVLREMQGCAVRTAPARARVPLAPGGSRGQRKEVEDAGQEGWM